MGSGQGAGDGGKRPVRFSYNGKAITAFEGDTVACALVRAGVHTFSRSMKFHRPRGLYCGTGRCISCLMRINGIPGVRTCTLPVAEGMVVESQGGFPNVRIDVLSLLDSVFRTEFDYHSRFIRPRFMTPVYQAVVRRLAAPARLPESKAAYPKISSRNCRVLVIGQGVSGSIATAHFRGADMRGVVTVDSMQGSEGRIPSVAFGVYEGGEVGVLIGDGVQIIKPDVLLLATGRFETGLPITNADLPGVLLPGALAQLAARRVPPGKHAVVIGTNPLRDSVLRNLSSLGVKLEKEIEDPSHVSRFFGHRRLRGAEIISNGARRRKVLCDTAVLLGPLVPAVALAQQAGCMLSPREGAFTVKVDSSGRTTVPSVFACGSVAGSHENSERIASGERVAHSIIKQLGVG